MTWKRRFHGSVLGLIGFILSPLSWWNDLFVNVPLALAFAWLVSLPYQPAFGPAVVVGYWLTNVLGLVLLHKGAQKTFGKGPLRPYTRRDLWRDAAISLLYTLLIVVLVTLKVVQPLTDYFQAK